MKKVAWANFNARHLCDHDYASNISTVHLTENDTASGKTLCGKRYPADKGYPSTPRYCKRCVKISRLTHEGCKALPYVPSVESYN